MGTYKCFDNFLKTEYKTVYNFGENCMKGATLFTEYGYGRVHDHRRNLYVVQLYSFINPDEASQSTIASFTGDSSSSSSATEGYKFHVDDFSKLVDNVQCFDI